jgi:hypothetical protein
MTLAQVEDVLRQKRGEERLELANPPELLYCTVQLSMHAKSFTLPTSHLGSISSSALFSLERKQPPLMSMHTPCFNCT